MAFRNYGNQTFWVLKEALFLEFLCLNFWILKSLDFFFWCVCGKRTSWFFSDFWEVQRKSFKFIWGPWPSLCPPLHCRLYLRLQIHKGRRYFLAKKASGPLWVVSAPIYRNPMQEERLAWKPIYRRILTAADGDGQQCRAAPACTASTELETKGSLEISALTKIKFLTENQLNQIENSYYTYERSLVLWNEFKFISIHKQWILIYKLKLYTLWESSPPA